MFVQTERQKLRWKGALEMKNKATKAVENGTSEVEFIDTTPARATGNLWNAWRYFSSAEGADSVMFKIPSEIK